ncbi:replicative DNA helicase [Paenibacillus sp. HN-1]|uniref:replicative DNA helicase n=1 Tax=Paenibacillus TaxID=44249 RepID=UPI001CA93599|nr:MULTISPECIES: replicative DNA helicase [Paenibacillus]MBY9081038.1 replicative DNA helicase [Paenibacillus sp. CGMCC 1.18879]MBY9087075.1 replicative DNA helicase [Paenibacillus sinensis]
MSDLAYGVEMPQSPEAEVSVLGAVLIDPAGDALETAMQLSPEAFYNPIHRFVFEAAKELVEDGQPVDIVSLSTILSGKKQLEEIGGVSFLYRLSHAVPTAANVDYYVDVLKDKQMLREVIRAGTEQIRMATESGDSAQVITAMQVAAARISDQAAPKREFKRVGEVGVAVYENMEYRFKNKTDHGITGIPSGFNDLDRLTAGFQRNDLIIVAARPSVGKTAFALNIAQNVAVRAGETVAIFSLEMSAEQLVQRMICAEANMDANNMRTATFSDDDWTRGAEAIGKLGEANILIDDSPALTVHEIRNKCRRLKKQEGLGLILIDYLQLISGSGKRGENRQQEVSEISRTLKQMARELEVPVIALSQLSRGVEQRQDKRPMLSDLRESGSIEQDADIVAFLYRDDYYNQDAEKKNIIEVIIAKHRNGPLGTAELVFLKQFNKFANYERAHSEQTPPPTGNVKEMNKRKWA